MNHRDKLIERLNSDTFLDFIGSKSVKYDTSLKLLTLIDKRVFNGITQKEVANNLGVSLSKVKRFEDGKVDSLSMYLYYVREFENLSNKKKIKVPKWIYQ